MSSSGNANSRWSLTRRRAEVMDLLRRHYETTESDEPEADYDPSPVSALHAALDRALELDEAAHEVTRPLRNREIAELLAERFGKRESGE